MSAEWQFDDPSIGDEDLLHRRVRKNPDCRSYDPVNQQWKVNPGALRRDADEGMSTHLESVLIGRDRDVTCLYDVERYASVKFEVAVPRQFAAGVLFTDAGNEIDADLIAAHTEVRPEKPEKNRSAWRDIVNEISRVCRWVQSPS